MSQVTHRCARRVVLRDKYGLVTKFLDPFQDRCQPPTSTSKALAKSGKIFEASCKMCLSLVILPLELAGAWGSGFRVQGCRVQGSGFRVQGFRV